MDMLRTLLSLVFLFSACKTSSHDTSGSQQAAAASQALPSPNACANFYAQTMTSLVDPATLTLANAQVSATQVGTKDALYIPKILVEADPKADLTYYEACNPTQGCFDGLILMPTSDQSGWYGTYEYRLPAEISPYTIAVQACVRADRLLPEKSGTVVHPTRYPDLELHCGSPFHGEDGDLLVYQQQLFPDSLLASKFLALDSENVVVTTKLYAMMNAIQAYTKQNPSSSPSSQLAGIISNLAQEREALFPLAKSTLMDQALQAVQMQDAQTGLALAMGPMPPPYCITNAQAFQAMLAATGTLTRLPAESSAAAIGTATGTNTGTGTDTGIGTSLQLSPVLLQAGNLANQIVATVVGEPTLPMPLTAVEAVVGIGFLVWRARTGAPVAKAPAVTASSAEMVSAGEAVQTSLGAPAVLNQLGVSGLEGEEGEDDGVQLASTPWKNVNINMLQPWNPAPIKGGGPSVINVFADEDQDEEDDGSPASNSLLPLKGIAHFLTVEVGFGTPLASPPAAEVPRFALVSTPDQTFLTLLNTLSQAFLTARTQYLALMADISVYLQTQL